MLLFTLSFLFGVSQLLWLPRLDINWLYMPMVLIVLVVFLKPKFSKIIIGLCLGFCFALVSGLYAKSHQLQFIPAENIIVTGVVSNLPTDKQDKTKFAFKVENYDLKKLLVSWYNPEQQVKAGQKWQLELKLKPNHGYQNPGSFDYSKWLFRNGYDATATIKSAQLLDNKSSTISSYINILRAKIGEIINTNFKSPRVQALIQALTIGDKSQISFEDSQLFQDTGTAHLIAISGLHIGLIAFVGILIGRLFFLIFTNQLVNRYKFEALFAISFALFYALLAGLSIPTIRALVMVVVFSLAHVFKFSITRWQAWSVAMLLVLLFDPFSVLDVGFWFSFGAVAVLMFSFTGRKLSGNLITSFIKAQLIILIGLMPLMVIVFQKINLLTPFANILVLPLASLLLIPLIFTSMFVYLFSASMAGYLFVIVEDISLYLFSILDYLQQFNFLNLKINNINSFTIGLLVVVMAVLLLPKLFRWRYAVLLLIIPLFLPKKNNLSVDELKVNILDVGQGLSIVVRTKNHTLIYDTGSKFDSGFNLASTVVIPYLQTQGIEVIDAIVLSHSDNDHAGGIRELVENFPHADVLGVTSEYKLCTYPKSWQWDGVVFEIISPYTIQPYLGNNSSCVIKVSSQHGSVLLTGDIEEPIEYRLVKNFPEMIQVDVLLIPHHGSRTSSSQDFIKKVNPKIAINSSGYANQFNHPHPIVKQLYLDEGVKFYDTQQQGMLSLGFDLTGIVVESYSERHKHFW